MAVDTFTLQFEKLSRIASDGALSMFGVQKGLTTLVKKETSCLSLDASDLVVCHCVTHQRVCVHIRVQDKQKQRAEQPSVQGATQ